MANASVLIVDDNVDFCHLLGRLIQRQGFGATCITSGEDALTYLAAHVPELMILDVMMPKMDGLEVLTAVRADARLKAMPVVMFSALADPALRQRALAAGANDWWLKAAIDFSAISQRLAPYVKASEKSSAPDHAKA
jgi:chemosensory pili system protein ChpA (sensor histidine kinase/response regulator)